MYHRSLHLTKFSLTLERDHGCGSRSLSQKIIFISPKTLQLPFQQFDEICRLHQDRYGFADSVQSIARLAFLRADVQRPTVNLRQRPRARRRGQWANGQRRNTLLGSYSGSDDFANFSRTNISHNTNVLSLRIATQMKNTTERHPPNNEFHLFRLLYKYINEQTTAMLM